MKCNHCYFCVYELSGIRYKSAKNVGTNQLGTKQPVTIFAYCILPPMLMFQFKIKFRLKFFKIIYSQFSLFSNHNSWIIRAGRQEVLSDDWRNRKPQNLFKVCKMCSMIQKIWLNLRKCMDDLMTWTLNLNPNLNTFSHTCTCKFNLA